MLYGCVTWSPRAYHYDTLRGAHRSFLTRRICWRKNNLTDHPIFYLDTLIKTGSETIEGFIRRRWILFTGFVGADGRYETADVRDVGRTGGGRGLYGRAGRRVSEVSPGPP